LLRKIILSVLLLAAPTAHAAELQRLDGATLVASGGNDGDSFQILHNDKKQIIRLYYVDCPETRATTQADARRLREQARYFGPFGVRRALPDGTHRDEATAQLDDQETVAMLKRKGLWKETDPDRLVQLGGNQRTAPSGNHRKNRPQHRLR